VNRYAIIVFWSEPSPAARDDATAQRLWQESERIAGFV
jgi:hypothetical protein